MSQFVGIKSEGLYVDETNALIFPVGNTVAAGDNIIRLSGDQQLLIRLRQNASQSQTGKYSYDGAIKAWVEALDRCLDRPPAMGPIPKLTFAPDGRLARMGLSPKVAQLVRNVLGMRMVHSDPGGEWPQGSGLLTDKTAEEIMRFARDHEEHCNVTYAAVQ
jgi:hypothetical protein